MFGEHKFTTVQIVSYFMGTMTTCPPVIRNNKDFIYDMQYYNDLHFFQLKAAVMIPMVLLQPRPVHLHMAFHH